MELVGGRTLAELIAGETRTNQVPGKSQGLGLADALPIARQIAEALVAAHDLGIIHRDLKPANIKITDDGTVKVLDFGLAKPTTDDASRSGANVADSPTLTSPAATALGLILGTAAYMAPEQAKGQRVDKRADVWAFGCVLYEMLSGRRAFEGDDVSDTLASLLKSDPDWRALPGDLPGPIRLLIERSLVKDRRQRVGDISTALFLLNEAAVLAPAVLIHPGRSPPRDRLARRWRRRMSRRRRHAGDHRVADVRSPGAACCAARLVGPAGRSHRRLLLVSESVARDFARWHRGRLRQCEPRCSARAEHSASSPFTRQPRDPRSARDVSRSPAVLFARRTIRRVFHEERGTQEDRALRRQSRDARREDRWQPMDIRRVARFRHDRLRWAWNGRLEAGAGRRWLADNAHLRRRRSRRDRTLSRRPMRPRRALWSSPRRSVSSAVRGWRP